MRLYHHGNDRKMPARNGRYPTLFTDENKWDAPRLNPGQKEVKAIVAANDATYTLGVSAEEVVGLLLRLPAGLIADAVRKARYFDALKAPEQIKQLAVGLFDRLKVDAAGAADQPEK